MMVMNQEIEVPTDAFIFTSILQGYYLFMLTVCGRHNRAVTNLYANLVQHCNSFVRQLQARYREPARFTYVGLLIETFIFWQMNQYITSLLSSAPVAAISGGTVPCPTFLEIKIGLENAMLMNLTELPLAIAKYVNPFHAPMLQDVDPVLRDPLKERDPKDPKTDRQQLTHPEWNKNLKRAWTTLGITSLYGVGPPFHDENQPNNKRRIMSDTLGVRICLSMALNGFCYSNCNGLHKCLSAGEVNCVATAGGMTLE
jgi:hypothetical protein